MPGSLYLLVILEGWLLCCVAERAVPASLAFLHRYTPTHIGAGHRATATTALLTGDAWGGSRQPQGCCLWMAFVGPHAVRGRSDVEIKAADLIRVGKLTSPTDRDPTGVPSVILSPDQKVPYVGQPALEEIGKELLRQCETIDGDRGGPYRRVPPTAISRFSYGGKTRMIKELALSLQQHGIPALFITFNEFTKPSVFELDNKTPLESIGLRIAWATATPEALERVAKASDKAAADLTFADWVENVSVSSRSIEEWLGTHPLALFVDELNLRIPEDTDFEKARSAKDFDFFVTNNFLNKRHRCFVFSSHVFTLGDNLEKYYYKFGGRRVFRPEIPRVQKLPDVTESGLCPDVHAGFVCWTGRAPSLLALMYSEERPAPDEVKTIFRKAKRPPLNAALAQDVVRTAVEGDVERAGGLGTWSRFIDVFDSSCLWPPCYLGLACRASGFENEVKSELGEGFASGLRVIPTLLDQLLLDRGSGKRWEGVAGAGILLRLLHSHLVAVGLAKADLSSAAAQVIPAAVNDGCKFGGVIQLSPPESVNDLIIKFHDKMDPTLPGEPSVSYFVKPRYSSFIGFDFSVFVCERGRLTTIYGFQCKEGPTGLDKDSVGLIKRSVSEALASLAPIGDGSDADKGDAGKPAEVDVCAIRLRGDQSQEVKRQRLDKVISVPSRASLREVFGVSVAQTCPFEWVSEEEEEEEEEGDDAGGEGTAA
ncbi:unnamed protein product [Vitrella brassicaformis CCMP3155]|uniref:ATPase AAA-type core domain-containing protein n=1 Tax=Vitrella brassicaformis (strain CCMP3155) TaxID=1169540 RepID=A0A0G4GSY6_VITBC|nr:unnamed protein product [Vitrella brassicaformis CCMP3155]|eukprot:CEM33821.1 unnamed protein product [Vitrella brassicaformis CCMP3155]